MKPTQEEKKEVSINFNMNEVLANVPSKLIEKYNNYFQDDIESMIKNSGGIIIDFEHQSNENESTYKWIIK